MVDSSRVEDLFLAVLELPSPDKRAAYLEEACRDDVELRQRVERLMEGHFKAQIFLETPVPSAAAAAPETATGNLTDHRSHDARIADEGANRTTREFVRPAGETVGSRIGPYKLLQFLGEGGMGVVYLAEQERPVKRRLALKVVKSGLDSGQVAARFEQERQALAMMDHPNIARIVDAGATERGSPFFAMELVKGIPLTRFCDQEHLTTRERLELFVPICQAVQHAHQKGIIHRDLKPSNVLVALYDGKPVPKIIDFGVAKATQQKLTERTMFTEAGSIVGTLEYMAPEQAELNNLDIDTRADVYSLGVLLYELLTGSPPFSAKQLRQAAHAEMLRMIREVEPPKPSTRLSESKESLASLAAQRRVEPARLTQAVRGELDWIVMKALEKDRTRRYDSAAALARDIERHLRDEPVEACPPSAGYRLRKFLRRHKGPVLAATLLALTVVVGFAGTALGLVEARRQREAADLARSNEAGERAKAERERDQKELARRAESEARRREAQRADAEAQAKREAQLQRDVAVAVRSFLQHDLLRQADATEQANRLLAAGGW
ncbi:MAG TPA: serine/threonine-protein kinase, partial [Pirellulales bacterium]|nr:serine/threonine-protein kinase [Pirellulales bacterium]